MAAAARGAANVSGFQKYFNAFRSWYVYAAGYRQMGLRADDLHMEENSDVTNAILRLSEDDQNLRIFRMKRALDLSMKHQILPKDQWTKPEEDQLYLTPIIEAVKSERKEREHWDRM